MTTATNLSPSSLRIDHRRTCPCGKVRYGGKPEAESGLHKLMSFADCYGTDRLHTYRCSKCEGWHIGHSDRALHRDDRTCAWQPAKPMRPTGAPKPQPQTVARKPTDDGSPPVETVTGKDESAQLPPFPDYSPLMSPCQTVGDARERIAALDPIIRDMHQVVMAENQRLRTKESEEHKRLRRKAASERGKLKLALERTEASLRNSPVGEIVIDPDMPLVIEEATP